MSFVWPFDFHRHARLASALAVAQYDDPKVDRASAADWLSEQLAGPDRPQELTVVWQSITRMYWPESERNAVDALLNERGAHRRLGHVSLEYPDHVRHGQPEARISLWGPAPDHPATGHPAAGHPAAGHPVRRRLLGTAHDHGIPVQVHSADPAP